MIQYWERYRGTFRKAALRSLQRGDFQYPLKTKDSGIVPHNIPPICHPTPARQPTYIQSTNAFRTLFRRNRRIASADGNCQVEQPLWRGRATRHRKYSPQAISNSVSPIKEASAKRANAEATEGISPFNLLEPLTPCIRNRAKLQKKSLQDPLTMRIREPLAKRLIP